MESSTIVVPNVSIALILDFEGSNPINESGLIYAKRLLKGTNLKDFQSDRPNNQNPLRNLYLEVRLK